MAEGRVRIGAVEMPVSSARIIVMEAKKRGVAASVVASEYGKVRGYLDNRGSTVHAR